MKKCVLIILIVVLFSSCVKMVESIQGALQKDSNYWIDTRSMTFYYEGRDTMTGITIWLNGDGKKIEFDNEPGQKSIQQIDLSGLRETITRQSVSIWITEANAHWREGVSFDISPADWKKKRRIVARHTYH